MPFPERRRQRGNIVAMMMAMVGMMGVAAVAGVNMLSGPITTASKVTNQNMAQNDLLMNAKVVVMNAATRPNGGDEDEDGYIEPAPFIPTSEESCNITLPGEGGCLPMDIGAIQTDPWGTQYAYCVWDHGTETGSENRIAGEDSTSGAVIAIISAGPNRQFETPCLPYDGDPETNDIGINPDGLGDDLVQIFTYAGAVSGSGGLWELKQGEPTTAVTAKDVEVDGAFRMGFAGEDPGQVGLASCTDMNHIGRMRFNPLDKAIEVCVFNGNYGWETLSGSSDSGAGGTSIIEGWPDAIVCGDGNRWATFHPSYEALNGDVHYLNSWQRQDYDQARSLMLVYSPDKTYKDVLYTAGWGTAVHQECVGKSISQLYADGQAFNFVGGGSGNSSGSTMVPGWPDAIRCTINDASTIYNNHEVILYRFLRDSGNNHPYASLQASTGQQVRIIFSDDGAYTWLKEIPSMTDISGDCAGKSISQLYADGLAFNFVGGGLGGNGGSKICSGRTTPGVGWVRYGTYNAYIDVDTSSCGFSETPIYTASIGGTNAHWEINGESAVYLPTSTSFRIYIQNNNATSTVDLLQYAQDFSYHINWIAMEPGTGAGAGGEGDNLGDHTATQNLDLGTHKLVGEGGTDGIYINSDGNVGIGTSAPGGKVDIVYGDEHLMRFGGSTASPRITFRHSGKPTRWTIDSAPYYLPSLGDDNDLRIFSSSNDNGTSGIVRFLIQPSGNVGIGTEVPAARLHVFNSSGAGSLQVEGDSSQQSVINLVTSGTGQNTLNTNETRGWHLFARGENYGDASQRGDLGIARWNGTSFRHDFHISRNGNVGIGTTSPRQELHIAGSGGGNQTAVQVGNGAGSLFLTHNAAHISGNIRYDDGNWRYEAAGAGSTILFDTVGGNIVFYTTSSGAAGAVATPARRMTLHHAGQTAASVPSTGGNIHGDWPAGWSGGIATFDVIGSSTYFTGYHTRSDRRYKEDINPLNAVDILEKMQKLRPVSYAYKKDDKGKTHFGFIAQEVRDVFPEIVTGEESEDSLLGLNYDGFISPLVLAVQELGSLINAVAKKITELFDHVANLRAELTSQNAAIETLKAENAALRSDLEAANDNFRRELDELRALMAE